MRQLIVSQSQWNNDPTIKERVNYFLMHYNLALIALAALSGSAFSAIEICNSQAFGIESLLFCIFVCYFVILFFGCCVNCVLFCVFVFVNCFEGLEFFNMGLTERHLKAFNSKRLYSTILYENLPQLCIQLW